MLSAGLDVFGRRGLGHATIGEICYQARLANRFFKQHFSSLEALFDAVYQHERDRLILATQAAFIQSKKSDKTAAEFLFGQIIRFFHDDPRRVRILLVDGPWRHATKQADGLIHAHTGQSLQDIGLCWMTYLHSGPKLDHQTKKLWHGLLGMTAQYIKDWALNGYDCTIDELIQLNMSIWANVAETKPTISLSPA